MIAHKKSKFHLVLLTLELWISLMIIKFFIGMCISAYCNEGTQRTVNLSEIKNELRIHWWCFWLCNGLNHSPVNKNFFLSYPNNFQISLKAAIAGNFWVDFSFKIIKNLRGNSTIKLFMHISRNINFMQHWQSTLLHLHHITSELKCVNIKSINANVDKNWIISLRLYSTKGLFLSFFCWIARIVIIATYDW